MLGHNANNNTGRIDLASLNTAFFHSLKMANLDHVKKHLERHQS